MLIKLQILLIYFYLFIHFEAVQYLLEVKAILSYHPRVGITAYSTQALHIFI